MIFEIRNAGFVNRGAFLMLLSVAAECRSRHSDCVISMVPSAPSGHQPFHLLAKAGFFPRIGVDRFSGLLNGFGAFVPERLRRRYGLILEDEVQVVFDAAGFAYGDPWPESNLRSLAVAARRAAKRDARFFLLPQSFGSFSSRTSRSLIKSIAESTTWIFPRDAKSLNNLSEVIGAHPRMSVAPDFTSLLPAVIPAEAERFKNVVAIIPNAKMLERTDEATKKNYLPFLATVIRSIKSVGLDPCIFVHEGSDDKYVSTRLAYLAPDTPVIDEPNPVALKGILGSCYACIGSRYHGLVSCLSQGVPSLATTWSSKYESLLTSYGIRDGLLELTHPETAIGRVERWLQHDLGDRGLRDSLLSRALSEQQQTRAMWQQIFGSQP